MNLHHLSYLNLLAGFFWAPLFGLIFSLRAEAVSLKDVECTAWVHDQARPKNVRRAVLKPSLMDSSYYEAELYPYRFGADLTFLNEEGVGLIVQDLKKKTSSDSTSGFRYDHQNRLRQTDLKHYSPSSKGLAIVAGVQCLYRFPAP